MSEHTRGAARKAAPSRSAIVRPADRRGIPSAGRIVNLLVGQSHGIIRLANGRDVFFHRSDVKDGASFNAFARGDRVAFELVEDHISGPRAIHVQPRRSRR